MEEIFNGDSKDEVHQKEVVIKDGIEAQLDDETLRMMTSAEESFEVVVGENGVENGKNEDGLASSSSSSDEETEVVDGEKTDDTGVIITANDEEERNDVLDLIKEELAVEIESIKVTELNVDEKVLVEDVPEAVEETVDEADISTEHEANGFVEEENEVTIKEDSKISEVDISIEHEANGFVEEENAVIITYESLISEADISIEHEANGFVEENVVIITDESQISEADISTKHEANGFVEENEVIITDESQISEAVVAVEMSDVVHENGVKEPGQAESVEEEVLSTVAEAIEAENTDQEGTNIETLQYRNEEDSLLAVAKSSNGTDESNVTELPETNGNPHIISISTRTVHPTSWKGCCGLLEVFRRQDR